MRCVQHNTLLLRTARGGGSSLKESEAVSKAGGAAKATPTVGMIGSGYVSIRRL